MERIDIFDTTLRDGEQSPGASMSLEQKHEFALQLEALGVDIIEAGFPISSPLQFEACSHIAKDITKSKVAALARAIESDIDSAADSIAKAVFPRIHTFISTSPIHMEHKLRKSPEEVLTMTKQAVRYARNRCAEVEFSPEDATRSDMDFLCRVIETAIAAGASIINIPDTVGYSTPSEIADIIKSVREKVSNIDKAKISIHCHDDMGLGVANTISALQAGARQAELTINGIGERAGNAALEEVVMAISVRKDLFQFETGIDTRKLYPSARMLSTIIGFPISRNKAIVGDNAFAHEAGIHQHGMLANRQTYEIMTPESVGRDASKIVLGRHSGMHGFRKRLQELNISLSDNSLKKAYHRFLQIADRKREIFDEDIIAITGDQMNARKFELIEYRIISGTDEMPHAMVKVRNDGHHETGEAEGDGPVDAIFRAIENATDIHVNVEEYIVQALYPGKQAMGEVSVVVTRKDLRASGHGSSTDILEASALAFVSAVGAISEGEKRNAKITNL